MAQWEEMGELCIEEEDIEEPCTEEDEVEELYATSDPIREEPPPKMTRNKSIAKKPTPKVPQVRGSGTLRFNSAEQRERYQLYMQKPVVPPYVLKLDTLEEFGIREEVEALLGEKEWKYILVDFEDAIYPDLVLEVMTTLQVPKTIDLMSTKCISFTVGSIVFQFSLDDLSRYLEIDAMQGLSEEELEGRETNVPNMLEFWTELLTCRENIHLGWVFAFLFQKQSYPKVKTLFVGPYLTRILRNAHNSIIPEIPYKQLQENRTEINRDILLSLFKDMRAILGPVGNTRKRARRGVAAQAQERAEVEEENEEAVGCLETRNEAHAYQTWLRGQFPPGPQYYYDPAGGPPHYYDPTGGPSHFYSSTGGSQPYYGAAGGSQYYFDPAEGSQPQYDPSRGPQFPYDPTDF
nr:hypothetical protein Iba_chr12fCG14490 [Ipomoea batatas]